MPKWPQLNPVEQQEKLEQITEQVLETLPAGWQRLVVRVTMIGPHSQLVSGVKMPDGSTRGWEIPPEVWRMFQQLRKGMYADGIGTWMEVEYTLHPPGRYDVRYNRDEPPRFDTPPTSEDFAVENKWFPRSEETMPEWYRQGLHGAHA